MIRDQSALRYEDEPATPEVRAGVSILEVLWCRKWLVVLLFAVGLGLGFLYFSKQVPIYQSTASILVMRTSSQLLLQSMEKDAGAERQAALSTQGLLIRSPLVVGLAVQGATYSKDDDLINLARQVDRELDDSADVPPSTPPDIDPEPAKIDPKKVPSLAGSRDPVSVIISGLSVRPARDSAEVLELSYRGADPQDCKLILDAVYFSYKSYLKGSRDSVTDNAVKLISKAQGELTEDLSKIEDEYRMFRQQQAGKLFKGAAGVNIHQARMTQIETARSEILLQRSQISAQLKAVTEARRRGDNREALLLSLEKGPASDGRPQTTLAHELLPFLLEEQKLVEDFGKDHPKVIAARNRIEMTRRYFRQQAETSPGGAAETPEIDLLDVYIQSLAQRSATLDHKDLELSELFASEQDEAKELEKMEAEDEAFRSKISRKQQLFAIVIKRLEEIKLADDLGGYDATMIADASIGSQIEPSLSRIMAIAGFLGLLAGVGLAYAVDLADKRFRDPDDIQRDLRLPLLGHIPLIPVKGVRESLGMSPALISFHQPMSRMSEAYRAVRTSLFFNNAHGTARVVQVTSPSSGDGKSTLSANLAISIAQAMKRVLLIDADLRRPMIHKLFSLKRDVGLSSVIGGDTEWNDAIISTQVKNLSLLTCGPRVSNPSELLTSPKFKELLDALRERYDYIILDSPPLLAISDPSVVAPRVDGVVLVLRITKQSRLLALRASKLLVTLGANVLGVVVNAVGQKHGYNYGYRGNSYGYGSRYGYGDGERDADSYYGSETAEDSAETVPPAEPPHRETGNPK